MTYTPQELFASTAPYYAKYRPGYDPALYDLLADRFPLADRHVLDLGTGTGVIALPLAPRAGHITAVDPEPGMLDEGHKLAAAAGVTNIDWKEGDSTTLADMHLPSFIICTMGAAFHWMDRDRVLQDLDAIIEPEGGVVLVSGGGPGEVEPPPWQPVVDEVRTRHLGPARRAGSSTYTHPKERHQDVLARSPFRHVDITRWDRTVTRTVDEVIGLQFSYSFSSPAQLGDRKDAFAQDLRAALTEFEPSGRYDETVRTEAIIGTRP
jgi:ubiquinone/menaquinone biosynthesis C-methylase UbiE